MKDVNKARIKAEQAINKILKDLDYETNCNISVIDDSLDIKSTNHSEEFRSYGIRLELNIKRQTI